MSDERQDPQSYLVPGSGVFKSPFVNGGVQSLELHVLHCQYSTISGLCVSIFLSWLLDNRRGSDCTYSDNNRGTPPCNVGIILSPVSSCTLYALIIES